MTEIDAPVAPLLHLTVPPAQPVAERVAVWVSQIMLVEIPMIGGAGFGLTVMVVAALASLTQPLETVVQVAV